MSVRIMTLVWDLDLPTLEKLVLLALADCASDEGECWPSISTLCRKTGAGERTIQRSINSLVAAGVLHRQLVTGKSNRYWVNPRHSGTPATQTPPSDTTQTPATVAPHPRHTDTPPPPQWHPNRNRTINEPSESSKRRNVRAKPKPKSEFDLPDWVPADAWSGFEEMRNLIRKPMTDRARTGIIDKLQKLRGPPGAILDQSTCNNWQDVYELKDKGNERAGSNSNHSPADKRDGVAKALHRRLAELGPEHPPGEAGRSDLGTGGSPGLVTIAPADPLR